MQKSLNDTMNKDHAMNVEFDSLLVLEQEKREKVEIDLMKYQNEAKY